MESSPYFDIFVKSRNVPNTVAMPAMATTKHDAHRMVLPI